MDDGSRSPDKPFDLDDLLEELRIVRQLKARRVPRGLPMPDAGRRELDRD